MLLESLNPTQLDAVKHTEGPLLILAGAGSGKTRVLTHRIAYLLEQGLAGPEEILAITFTNKAAREMKERVALLVGPDSRKMWVSTFHAFCARILRAHADKLGYRREFTIYDTADQVRLVKRCIIELGKDPKRFNPRSFQAQISDAKNRLLAADDFLRQTEGYMAENVAEVYDLYQQRLYENNAMDFDDLIMQTVALLEIFPEVRERYQTRFRYIHVDEYQDTNHAQYRLVNILAAARRNLCVVGDDDQCLVEGTPVMMADGSEKPIEDVAEDDEVLSAYGSGDFRPARVTAVARRERVDGVRISTRLGREVVSTPEHTHFAGYRLGLTPQMHFTYLMHKSDVGFRLGTSQVYTNGRVKPTVGFAQRCRQEHGDAVWVLSSHASEIEARAEEMVLSLRHRIPTLPFVPRKGRSSGGLVSDEAHIKRVFSLFDTGSSAMDLLAERGLHPEYPHYRPQSYTGRRRNLVVTLCGDRRGASPMHRISMVGRDEEGRSALESLGLSVRPAKQGSVSWRFETCYKDFGRLMQVAERIREVLDVSLVFQARLGGSRGWREANSLPFVPAGSVRPGMVMFAGDGEYDVVESVERILLDRPVYDIDVEGTHNFVAGGIVTHNSVYSWRGADIRNILDFERDYPEATVVKLEQNYRSTQTILSAANAVVANNASRKRKELWTAGDEGERIRVFTASDEYAEARFVVAEVERLMEGGVTARDIAAFYRTNAQSRALEDVLVREGVPYQIVGGVKFYERAEIKDAMAYLSVISNPNDSVSLERIINVPKRGLGNTSVAKLQDYASKNGISLYEALGEAGEVDITAAARKSCRALYELFEGWRVAAKEVPPAELIGAVLDESGYKKELDSEGTVEAESRLENLEELINAAREYESVEPDATLDGFLQEQALYSETDKVGVEGRVTLMTLHNAKGLEYDHVFVVGMEEGTFPHARSLDEQNLEEERRLCYVGITRARKTLTLSYAKLRSNWGEREYQMPSRFLSEIPDEYKSGTISGGTTAAAGRGGWGRALPKRGSSSPEPASDSPSFRAGEKVRHAKFGEGEILESGAGKVVVR
ncbi:MAG TPA: UvrD-helicase domain-containing protein, partial [Rubrobacteraceae bacterium]|nr:UvrD-helicase domain-containing protein [Rubrobacteraceae bacterium]